MPHSQSTSMTIIVWNDNVGAMVANNEEAVAANIISRPFEAATEFLTKAMVKFLIVAAQWRVLGRTLKPQCTCPQQWGYGKANRLIRLASMFVLGVQKGSDDVRYIKMSVLKSRFRIYRGAGTNIKFSKKHFLHKKPVQIGHRDQEQNFCHLYSSHTPQPQNFRKHHASSRF